MADVGHQVVAKVVLELDEVRARDRGVEEPCSFVCCVFLCVCCEVSVCVWGGDEGK